jgi:hypothetical protein
MNAAKAVKRSKAAASVRAASSVLPVPLIWRLRLVLHGVRLSPLAYEFEPARGARRDAAYCVGMAGCDLSGAEQAPLAARVNIRAASFVLRAFGVDAAEIRADADGAVEGIDPQALAIGSSRWTLFPTRETLEHHARA